MARRSTAGSDSAALRPHTTTLSTDTAGPNEPQSLARCTCTPHRWRSSARRRPWLAGRPPSFLALPRTPAPTAAQLGTRVILSSSTVLRVVRHRKFFVSSEGTPPTSNSHTRGTSSISLSFASLILRRLLRGPLRKRLLYICIRSAI